MLRPQADTYTMPPSVEPSSISLGILGSYSYSLHLCHPQDSWRLRVRSKPWKELLGCIYIHGSRRIPILTLVHLMDTDFNVGFLNYLVPLLDDVFPVLAFNYIIGASEVFSMTMKTVTTFWPDAKGAGGNQFTSLPRSEDPIEHIANIVEPFPGRTKSIPEALAIAEDCPERGEPYDASDRRNVFMIEKLLDDDMAISVSDVYNNAEYEWSVPYDVGAEQKRSPHRDGLDLVGLEIIAGGDGDEEEDDGW